MRSTRYGCGLSGDKKLMKTVRLLCRKVGGYSTFRSPRPRRLERSRFHRTTAEKFIPSIFEVRGSTAHCPSHFTTAMSREPLTGHVELLLCHRLFRSACLSRCNCRCACADLCLRRWPNLLSLTLSRSRQQEGWGQSLI